MTGADPYRAEPGHDPARNSPEPAQPAEPPAPEPPELSGQASDPERTRRADRATRGGLAGLLCLEAFVVLLVPRAIAQTSTGLDGTKTWTLVALAIVLIATGFLLRRPWGIGLGSALQLVLAVTIALIPAIAVVILFFLFIWWYLLRTRHQLLGTPSGWRMLIS